MKTENFYAIYQVKIDRKDYLFKPLDEIRKNGLVIDPANYNLAYQAPLEGNSDPESLFFRFNVCPPVGFHGRSMSISDIIVFCHDNKKTAYYCDSFGFIPVPEFLESQKTPTPDERETGETISTPRGTFFVTDLTREEMESAGYSFHHASDNGDFFIMTNGMKAFAIRSTTTQKIDVIVVEPKKKPYIKKIEHSLDTLQREVGGYIEIIYPFTDKVAIICNEEGKINGLELNRPLCTSTGEVYDVIAGTFLIAGVDEDEISSLPPELISKYTEIYAQPKQFYLCNGHIIVLPS